MENEQIKSRTVFFLKKWLESRAALVNHKGVIKDIYLEVDISAGYFLMLTIANLIALMGLITNSVAVIIGAMLISPLMGPILSSGFAFITGDVVIGKKALKKVSYSVVITILIATFITYLSPLQEVTSEITARTRPNLYDLIIAVLAGTAGAIAICTKKSYITIVTGVAIATAVIPPLSVAGFGLGIGRPFIALGGFLLFFTNFVAIILATCIVFYIHGFKPGITTEIEMENFKKRAYAFAALLFIISIPLLYTLRVSILEIRLRNSVDAALKLEFNRERISRLDSFTFSKGNEDVLDINAVVNTISYMKEDELKGIEKSLSEYLQKDVILDVEQVLVKAGGLKEEPVKQVIAPAVVPQKPPAESAKSQIEGVMAAIMKTSEKVEKIIEPSRVVGFYVGTSEKAPTVSVILKIKRDEPLFEEQTKWLKQILSDELRLSIELTVETIPTEEVKTKTAPKAPKKKAKR